MAFMIRDIIDVDFPVIVAGYFVVMSEHSWEVEDGDFNTRSAVYSQNLENRVVLEARRREAMEERLVGGDGLSN